MWRSERRKIMAVFLASLVVVSCVGLSGDAGADFAPHTAIYKIRMAESGRLVRFSGIDGAAVSSLEQTCQGWTVNEQVLMTMFTPDGGAVEREITYKARESSDGRQFYFQNLSRTNGTLEEFEGTARRKATGEAEAEYVAPRPVEMPLPKGTLFYVEGMKWLVNLAKSGTRAGEAYGFDGSDETGARKITAFILPDGADVPLKGDASLLQGSAWRAQLGFYPVDGRGGEPEFEVHLRFLENGVVTHMKTLVDGMIIDQVLEDLLPGQVEGC